MKGPFFLENRISYDIIGESKSSFEDVDVSIDRIKLNYNVKVEERIEGLDTYWVVAGIDNQYEICIRYHDLIGLTICAENEQSNEIVTEIANYLSKEVFNEREDISHTP